MKIYLFHPETGVYLGEDYADESMFGGSDRMFPPDTTTLAPPVVKPGFVALFRPADGRWTVHARKELRGALEGASGEMTKKG